MLESEFGRSMSNLGKAGAYYTNLEECSKISNFFEWPEDEVAMLEPCAGDGKAILEVTKGCQQRKILMKRLERWDWMKMSIGFRHLLVLEDTHQLDIL